MAYLVIDKVMNVHTETRCETFKEAIKKLNESIEEYYGILKIWQNRIEW